MTRTTESSAGVTGGARGEPTIRRRLPTQPLSIAEVSDPVLRRLYSARGVRPAELSLGLGDLLPPGGLKGLDAAADLLAEAIIHAKCIVIAGDYDADGATATAVAILGLRALGATQVEYVVPNRFTMGYGLSPALVELAQARGAQLLVTVDNGIASLAGVAAAEAIGLPVLITDHHLAGPELPPAAAIVNPNQPGCSFASKHLAGVGVMFYVLLALRAKLRAMNRFSDRREPNLAELLDLVALGTVADVVRLDHNNRILVAQGLARIRSGRGRPGLHALLEAAQRSSEHLNAGDLGFVIGPRLNAAGRLDDMTVGIECLLAGSLEAARPFAHRLDGLNRERRGIEAQMRLEALDLVTDSQAVGVCLFNPGWHEGVVGLAASRVKDRLHRPVIAFARSADAGILKGSGRSIHGFNLRDALAAVDARHPGLLTRFGGHAMAAGLTLPEDRLPDFESAFDAECRACLDSAALELLVETDGELEPSEISSATALAIETGGPWGQGFPAPLFEGHFTVLDSRPLGSEGQHLRLRLAVDGSVTSLEAIQFNADVHATPGSRVALLYRLTINRWRGTEVGQLVVEQLRAS